jgi:excisionase family DNA binding protein
MKRDESPLRPRIFRTWEAAEYLGLSKATLEAWRSRGGGPVFLKLGKAVRYRQDHLDAFAEANLRANTSQQGGVRGNRT